MEKYEELFNPSFLQKESAAKEACDNRPPLPKDAAVTMAYVPLQTDIITYDEDKALQCGTLFPALNKVFLGGSAK